MNPERFRAYAAANALSRREIPVEQGDGSVAIQKVNVTHEVHNPVVEDELADGVAEFTAKSAIAHVAFYGGDPEHEVCLGRVDGPFGPGKVEVSFADVPKDEPVDLGNGVFEQNGTVYRKAD
jgi:hypothetical protein